MVRILIDLQPSELGRISGSRKLSLMIKQYVSHLSSTDSSICSSWLRHYNFCGTSLDVESFSKGLMCLMSRN